jgi:AcrR family transcriptional regulator
MEILDAAASLFAEKGYERTPVKEIAERAGIAPGTIYLYFEGKRDLLLSIADRVIGQAWSETQTQLAALDKEAYIATVLQNVSRFVRENQAFLQALIPEIWTDDDLQDQFFNQILAPLFETGAGYLEEQIATGQARPCEVEIVIPAIAGSLIMLPLFHTLAPKQFLVGFSEDDLVEELTRLYLEGLKPSPEEGAP